MQAAMARATWYTEERRGMRCIAVVSVKGWRRSGGRRSNISSGDKRDRLALTRCDDKNVWIFFSEFCCVPLISSLIKTAKSSSFSKKDLLYKKRMLCQLNLDI